MAERISAHDEVFFFLEGPTTPYHIASLSILEGDAPAHDEMIDLIAARLARIPRFRQVVRAVPFGRPVWCDDPHFDPGYHIRRISLPVPGDDEQLKRAIAPILAQHLNRHRPLWEVWVVEGLAGNRFALLTKAHHALVDGIGGVRSFELMCDGPVEGEPLLDPEIPSSLRLALEAIGDRIRAPVRAATGIATQLAHPIRLAKDVAVVSAGLAALIAQGLRPAPHSPMNTPIGPHRQVDFVRGSLDDFKAAKGALGGSVNDAVLAVTAGALRRWYLSRRLDTNVTLKALVPVSRRKDAGIAGNVVTGLLAPLPLHATDAVHRFGLIRNAMRRAKRSPLAVGAGLVLELSSVVPRRVAGAVAGVQRVQRFFNLSLPNVPGSTVPLTFAGRPIIDMFPFPPLSANAGLIVAAMSYNGRMNFGLVSDPAAVPDLAVIAEGLEKAIVDLVHSAESIVRGGVPWAPLR